jgi:hypothetical protein
LTAWEDRKLAVHEAPGLQSPEQRRGFDGRSAKRLALTWLDGPPIFDRK